MRKVNEMQKAPSRQADHFSGEFQKFNAAQKAQTPSVVRLINGFGSSTLFKAFQY